MARVAAGADPPYPLSFVLSFVANFVESLFLPWSNLPTKLRTKLATKFSYCDGGQARRLCYIKENATKMVAFHKEPRLSRLSPGIGISKMNIQHSTLNIEHRIKIEFIRSWKFDVQIISGASSPVGPVPSDDWNDWGGRLIPRIGISKWSSVWCLE
jgi:hypothetical protein